MEVVGVLLERRPDGQMEAVGVKARWTDGSGGCITGKKARWPDGSGGCITGKKARWPDGSGGCTTRKEAVESRECTIFFHEIYA